MCSAARTSTCRLPAFPIRHPPDQSSVDGSPGTVVASHVLHRFLVPRHPPCALKNLATDARVHCAVLKQRPDTHPHNPTSRRVRRTGTEATTIRPLPQDPTTCPTHPTLPSFPRTEVQHSQETTVCAE